MQPREHTAMHQSFVARDIIHSGAWGEKEEARSLGRADVLTYSFLIHLALHLEGTKGAKKYGTMQRLSEEGRAAMLKLYEQMTVDDGLPPTAIICHRMFPVWLDAGQADKADAVFQQMKASSASLHAVGDDLAARWLHGDLQP